MSNVKLLREKFEKLQKGGKPLTPIEFAEAQKKAAESEAKAILDARRKAATYNMQVRIMKIKSANALAAANANAAAASSASSAVNAGVKVSGAPGQQSSSPSVTRTTRTATAKSIAFAPDVVGGIDSPSSPSDTKRDEVRARARKYSISLAKSGEEGSEEQEAKATQALLQVLTIDEKEHAKAEQIAKEKAEKEAKKKAEKEAKEKAEREAREKEEASRHAQEEGEKKAKEAEEAKRLAQEEEHDRVTLTSYLKENYPDRLGDVESLLKEYRGHLDILFEELTKARMEAESKAAAAAQEKSGPSSSEEHVQRLRNDSNIDQKVKDDLQFIRSDSLRVSSLTSLAANAEATLASHKRASTHPVKNKKFLDDGVSLDDMLRQFYSVFAPTKVNDVASVLKHFENRESDLIHTLELKYNVTFLSDGTCTPNDAAAIGEPFIGNSKFAVDVQKFTLRERLKQAGASAEKVQEVLSSQSAMM